MNWKFASWSFLDRTTPRHWTNMYNNMRVHALLKAVKVWVYLGIWSYVLRMGPYRFLTILAASMHCAAFSISRILQRVHRNNSTFDFLSVNRESRGTEVLRIHAVPKSMLEIVTYTICNCDLGDRCNVSSCCSPMNTQIQLGDRCRIFTQYRQYIMLLHFKECLSFHYCPSNYLEKAMKWYIYLVGRIIGKYFNFVY